MSKMCSMSTCSTHKSFCGHEKMMMGLGVLLGLAAFAHWGLGLI